jgi:hypothetical protein
MNFSNFFILFYILPVCYCSFLTRFEQWVQDFKIDITSDHHFNDMLEKWVNNHRYIEDMNLKNLTFKLGHNQFSGMDSIDFSRYLGISKILFLDNDRKPVLIPQHLGIKKISDSIDWVSLGGVTPVKDQGQCGSCWSFSTTGALEGAYFVKYGHLKSFSEQQLVDCDNRRNGGKDMGCNGGLMDNAFSWISKNNGLCSGIDYPYVSGKTTKSGDCQSKCENIKNSAVSSFVDIIRSSDVEIMSAVSKQPISIAIQADQREFQLYKSGVFTGICGTDLDHGVLLVGYGSQDEIDFYLVKNSWGTTWGDKGYIKLGRGKQYNNGDGQCGLLLQASYPILKKIDFIL